MSNSNGMIELSNVSKQFGKRWAVEELVLTVPQGEIFGLLGHNGAGKSTAIGMMLGQVWPTSGEVCICGHNVAKDRRNALARVGAIFESPVFYDYLSGWRNLELLSYYSGPTSPQRRWGVRRTLREARTDPRPVHLLRSLRDTFAW